MSRDFRAGLIVGLVVGLIAAIGFSGRGQTSLTFSIGSYHLDRDKTYCEFNPGVGLAHKLSEATSAVFGVYRNSSCDTSFYAGAIHEPSYLRFANWRGGLLTAVATGYGDHALTLVGGATVLVPSSIGLDFRLVFIPAASKGVIALFVERRW